MPPTLETLIARARAAWQSLTPEQHAAQMQAQAESRAQAEAGMGSDADEAAYRHALRMGDSAKLAELEAQAQARMEAIRK